MPEETQVTSSEQPVAEVAQPSLPEQPAPAPVQPEVKKAGNPLLLPIIIFVGLVFVVAAGAAAVWFFMTQNGNANGGNNAGQAAEPQQLIADANTQAKTYFETLDAQTIQKLQENPTDAYETFYKVSKDEAYDFDVTFDLKPAEAAGDDMFPTTINLAGQFSTHDETFSAKGMFNVKVSAFNVKGEFIVVDKKLYVNITEGGEILPIPAGWIGADLTDAISELENTAGVSNEDLTAEQKAEIEEVLGRLKSFDGDVLVNSKSLADRNVKGENLKCASAEINPDIAVIFAEGDELAEVKSALEMLTAYEICSVSEDKPMYYQIGAAIVEQEAKVADVNFIVISDKLSTKPTFTAPAASEVTDISEIGGQ